MTLNAALYDELLRYRDGSPISTGTERTWWVLRELVGAGYIANDTPAGDEFYVITRAGRIAIRNYQLAHGLPGALDAF